MSQNCEVLDLNVKNITVPSYLVLGKPVVEDTVLLPKVTLILACVFLHKERLFSHVPAVLDCVGTKTGQKNKSGKHPTSGRAMVPLQRRQKTASSGGSPRCSSSATAAILKIWNVKYLKPCLFCGWGDLSFSTKAGVKYIGKPLIGPVQRPFKRVLLQSSVYIYTDSYISK